MLDFDDGRGPPSDWPDTAELWTPRGVHLWYRVWLGAPRLTKTSVVIDGRRVDVCPAGTLEIIVGPGRHYVHAAVADLPRWLDDALGHHRTGRRTPAASARGGSLVAAADAAGLLNRKISDCAVRAWLCPGGDGSPVLAGF